MSKRWYNSDDSNASDEVVPEVILNDSMTPMTKNFPLIPGAEQTRSDNFLITKHDLTGSISLTYASTMKDILITAFECLAMSLTAIRRAFLKTSCSCNVACLIGVCKLEVESIMLSYCGVRGGNTVLETDPPSKNFGCVCNALKVE